MARGNHQGGGHGRCSIEPIVGEVDIPTFKKDYCDAVSGE